MSVMFRETVDEASSYRIIINAMADDEIDNGALQIGVKIYEEGYEVVNSLPSPFNCS